MLLLYLAALPESPAVHDEYMYSNGRCFIYEDDDPNIFWGLHDDQCLEVARVDERLNLAYRASMRRLRPPQKQQLRMEQRKWLKSLESLCRIRVGGAIVSTPEADCFVEQAKKRAAALTRL
jgi:uncharacterized protein YecT (DUF1311 family)